LANEGHHALQGPLEKNEIKMFVLVKQVKEDSLKWFCSEGT